jgi:hypothetical protein
MKTVLRIITVDEPATAAARRIRAEILAVTGYQPRPRK